MEARQPGYDAVDSEGNKIQIKGRLVDGKAGQLGKIRTDVPWDNVLLVILDKTYEPIGMYQAKRDIIVQELKKPGSKLRNNGVLSISKFKSIATKVL